MRLFCEGDLEDYFRDKMATLRSKVDKMTDQEITSCDFDEWISYLEQSYHIDPIELLSESVQQRICESMITVRSIWARYGENEYVDVEGYKISFDIPFDGDPQLFRFRPSCFSLGLLDVESLYKPHGNEYGRITIMLCFTRNQYNQEGERIKETISAKYQQQLSSLTAEIERVNNDVNAFNGRLFPTIRQMLTQRKEKALSFAQVSQIFQIPLPIQSGSQGIHPIQLSRTVKQLPQRPVTKPLPVEYAIDDKDYNRIIDIIYSAGTTMEKTARSYFGTKQEEELRDVLLVGINSQYENASGETFRRVGKTDIRVEMDNQAAYIAECKIWHGIKAFSDAVVQLLSYCTWRDTKTSLVLFNKSTKDFMKILQEISGWVSTNTKSNTHSRPNMWICRMHKEEANIDVTICISVFDLCVDKSEFKDQRYS